MTAARILVVDDTPANVKLLVDLLSVNGFDVIAAGSGTEGPRARRHRRRRTSCCST